MKNAIFLASLALSLVSESASAAGDERELSYFCGLLGRPGATLNLVLATKGDKVAASIQGGGRSYYSRANQLDLDVRNKVVFRSWDGSEISEKLGDIPDELRELLGKGAIGFDKRESVTYSSAGFAHYGWFPSAIPSTNGLHVGQLFIPIALFDDLESELIGLQVGEKLSDSSKKLENAEFVLASCKRTETRDL